LDERTVQILAFNF
jgi:hypothetical protein